MLVQRYQKDNEEIRAFRKFRDFDDHSSNDNSDLYCPKGRKTHTIINRNEREVQIDIVYGYKIYADTNGAKNFVTEVMANTGTFEPDLVSAVGRFVRPGYKVLNFGTQFGM